MLCTHLFNVYDRRLQYSEHLQLGDKACIPNFGGDYLLESDHFGD
jgi:hypothetical protein